MFDKPLEKLAKIQEKYPAIVLLVVLIVSLFLGYYALRLETDASFSVMFREDSDTIQLGNLVKNEFGGRKQDQERLLKLIATCAEPFLKVEQLNAAVKKPESLSKIIITQKKKKRERREGKRRNGRNEKKKKKER